MTTQLVKRPKIRKGGVTTSQPKGGVGGGKLSFPEWKKKNPNGTAAQYKQYKG